jgi:hypothetical protein
MSLLKLYATGIQTDPISHITIHNINNKYDKQCQNCVQNNTIPKLFFYYGPKLASKINLHDYKFDHYNAVCNEGHTLTIVL